MNNLITETSNIVNHVTYAEKGKIVKLLLTEKMYDFDFMISAAC